MNMSDYLRSILFYCFAAQIRSSDASPLSHNYFRLIILKLDSFSYRSEKFYEYCLSSIIQCHCQVITTCVLMLHSSLWPKRILFSVKVSASKEISHIFNSLECSVFVLTVTVVLDSTNLSPASLLHCP